jgi:hypothetical protein
VVNMTAASPADICAFGVHVVVFRYLFSANGALFRLAWGKAPGFQVAYRTSAESAIQRANESRLQR